MNKLIAALHRLSVDQSLIVGAGQPADVVLSFKGIAKQHARFLRNRDGLFVQDLDSDTGTFRNGCEIRGLERLAAGDKIRFGEFEFVYQPPTPQRSVSNAPVEFQSSNSAHGDVTLSLVNVSKRVSGRRQILDDVSLHLKAGQFVGILGASGSGKSTLIKGIAGLAPFSSGQILIQGQPLSPADLRAHQRIAYLPQDVVIHESLTAQSALEYIARLKGVGSTADERLAIVTQTLERVGLASRAHVRIDKLSGGQRKRVALAAELIGDPQIILLDEATSGLDPATEAEIMELFRSLADEGRIVVCITHYPEHLRLCDRLLFLSEGQCCFYGTPDEMLRYFAIPRIEDVYRLQKQQDSSGWHERFQNSKLARRIAEQLNDVKAPQTGSAAVDSKPNSSGSQIGLLSQRYLKLMCSDAAFLLLILIQAPAIAILIGLSYGKMESSYAELHAGTTKEVLFLLVVSMLWCAGTASVREIVKELPILRHESRFGISIWAYVVSKLIVLGTLSLIQAALLLAGVRYLTDLPGEPDFEFLILGVTAIVGVAQGLVISVIAKSSERAMTILPVMLIGQAVFSGGLARLEGWVLWLSKIGSPAYWSLDAMRAMMPADLQSATYAGAPGKFQHPILGSGGPLAGDLTAMAVQLTGLVGITWLCLTLTLGRRVRLTKS